MKGGAIPLFVFATLVGVLFAINWIWTDDTLNVSAQGFAVGLMIAVGASWAARNRTAVERGMPEPADGPETIPEASLGAPLLGVAIVTIGFGLVFGPFLVFIGAGLCLAAIGLLVRELRDQRRARRMWLQEHGER